MTPILAHELSTAPASNRCGHSGNSAGVEDNIIAALIEALSAPGRYRLSERAGELFIETVELARY